MHVKREVNFMMYNRDFTITLYNRAGTSARQHLILTRNGLICMVDALYLCRISNNETQIEAVGQLIRRFFYDSGRFSPSDMLIVTWDRVGPYNGGSDQVYRYNVLWG